MFDGDPFTGVFAALVIGSFNGREALEPDDPLLVVSGASSLSVRLERRSARGAPGHTLLSVPEFSGVDGRVNVISA